MCGRFALFRWSAAFAGLPGYPADQAAHWNYAPGHQVLMLGHFDDSGVPRLARGRWGLTPPWLDDLSRTPAHARAETLADQPMFRNAFAERRCLVPANGFYEWRGIRKQPYWVTADAPLLYLAGIWECFPVAGIQYLSVALVTLPAGASMRRPLLLDEAGQAAWLAPETAPAERLGLLSGGRVSLRERALARLVNDPALDGPECLTPA